MRQDSPPPLCRHRGRGPSSRNGSSTLDSADAAVDALPAASEGVTATAAATASGGSGDGKVAQAVVMPPPPQSLNPAPMQLTRLSSMDSVSLTDEGAVGRRRRTLLYTFVAVALLQIATAVSEAWKAASSLAAHWQRARTSACLLL